MQREKGGVRISKQVNKTVLSLDYRQAFVIVWAHHPCHSLFGRKQTNPDAGLLLGAEPGAWGKAGSVWGPRRITQYNSDFMCLYVYTFNSASLFYHTVDIIPCTHRECSPLLLRDGLVIVILCCFVYIIYFPSTTLCRWKCLLKMS